MTKPEPNWRNCHKSTLHVHAAGHWQWAKPLILLENLLNWVLPVLCAFPDISGEISFGKGAVIRVLLMLVWISSAPCRAAPCLKLCQSACSAVPSPSSCSSSTKHGKFKYRYSLRIRNVISRTQRDRNALDKRRNHLSLVNWAANLLLLLQVWSEMTEKFKPYPLDH